MFFIPLFMPFGMTLFFVLFFLSVGNCVLFPSVSRYLLRGVYFWKVTDEMVAKKGKLTSALFHLRFRDKRIGRLKSLICGIASPRWLVTLC